MLEFIERFMSTDPIPAFVDSIWSNFDSDNSGYLDKMETYNFLN